MRQYPRRARALIPTKVAMFSSTSVSLLRILLVLLVATNLFLRLSQPELLQYGDNRVLGQLVENGKTATSTGKDYKVIVFVFAGRRSRMEILHQYVEILLGEGHIDEYHVWNKAQNQNDHDFLVQESNRLPRTRMFTYSADKNVIGPWTEPYLYYKDIFRADVLSPNDVLIKIDDDITFIDLQEFPGFVEYVANPDNSQYWTVAPQVINNGIFAFYQRTLANTTSMPLECVSYLPTEMELNRGDQNCRKQVGGPFIHHKTIKQPLDYQKCLLNHSLTSIKSKTVAPFVMEPVRYSINLFATSARNIQELADFVVSLKHDDEYAITAYAHCMGKRSVVYPALVVAHLSFGPQNKALEPALLPLYRNYTKNYIAAYKNIKTNKHQKELQGPLSGGRFVHVDEY